MLVKVDITIEFCKLNKLKKMIVFTYLAVPTLQLSTSSDHRNSVF